MLEGFCTLLVLDDGCVSGKAYRMTKTIVLEDAKGVRGISERTTVRRSHDNIQPYFTGCCEELGES